MMGYCGWRFSCDMGTMERLAGACEIEADSREDSDPGGSTFLLGAAAGLRALIADGDNVDPREYAAQVMARATMRGEGE